MHYASYLQRTVLLISAPSLGVYYCQQLTLSVCPSVTKLQIASSFLLLDGIEPFFGRQFSMTPSTKRYSSIFDLGPLTPKILLPKICTKSPITRLVRHRPEMSGPNRGFRGWPIQWNHAKCCGPTLVAMATKFGLGAEI